MTSSRRNRRRFAHGLSAAAYLLLLSACSSERNGEWDIVYNMISQTFGGEGPGVTYQQAAAVPFASIGIRVGSSAEGMLVLGTTNRDEQIWSAASHIVLLTRGGRILRTAGLEHNRTDMRIIRGDISTPSTTGVTETVWEADFADLHLSSVPIVCRATPRGTESIDNFGTAVPTVRVDEECRSGKLDWSYTNSYWISPKDGLTWRSVQYISPKLDPLKIRLLRPPSQ
jgi:Group 4 capsule polysaccharide lipoprotein gfcB, YjbF